MTRFTSTTTEPIIERAYIVRRKAGWYAISKRKIDASTQETTVVGTMSREDAALTRDSLKQAEVSHYE